MFLKDSKFVFSSFIVKLINNIFKAIDQDVEEN